MLPSLQDPDKMAGAQSFLQMSRDVSHSLQDGTRGEKATGDDMPWLSQFAGGDFCLLSRMWEALTNTRISRMWEAFANTRIHEEPESAALRNCPVLFTSQYSKAKGQRAMTPPQHTWDAAKTNQASSQ